MEFLKELYTIREARMSDIIAIISMLLLFSLFMMIFFRLVDDKITVKNIVLSLIYSPAIFLSFLWISYYDEKNGFIAIIPICFWLLCLLIYASIRYKKKARSRNQRKMEAFIEEGERGKEKVLSYIIPETANKEGKC